MFAQLLNFQTFFGDQLWGQGASLNHIAHGVIDMLGTEFIQGQGLGNQLLAYVSARAIAKSHGYEFGCAGLDHLGINIHSNAGVDFLQIDTGHEITADEIKNFTRYDEKEERIFVGNSLHDINNGCYVAGADPTLIEPTLSDNTLLYGNLQDESYFAPYLSELKDWLKIKPDRESDEYTRDSLCIINMRGGEYTDSPELFLDRKYWLHGMEQMKKIRSDMEFMIVTEDVPTANKLLPGIPAYHFDVAKDYITIKNACYLLLSNSSFAVLPAFTSDTLQYAIAPKYWARHNVSDGYWASEQNIYSIFHYMDRKGRIFTPGECRAELDEYQACAGASKKLDRMHIPATGLRRGIQIIRAKSLRYTYYTKRAIRSIIRRISR